MARPDLARVQRLLDQAGSVESIVPVEIGDAELWENLMACCRAFQAAEGVSALLKPLIGRMLRLIESYPMEWFESKSYRSFGDFMQRGLRDRFNISPAEGYKLLSLSKKLGSVTLEDYQQIGYTKLNLVASVAKDGDSTLPRWLEAARTNNTDTLRQMVESSGSFEPGALAPATIRVPTSVATYRRFEAFMRDPEIRAFCGSDSSSVILQRMMDECEGEWRAQGRGVAADNDFERASKAVIESEPESLPFE